MVREGLIEYPYLLILINLLSGYWKNQLKRENMKMYEDNSKAVEMLKVRNSSSNAF